MTFHRHDSTHEEKEDGTFVLTVHANFQLAAHEEYEFRFALMLEKVSSSYEQIFYEVSLKKPVDTLRIFVKEKQVIKSIPLVFQLSNCEKKNRAVRLDEPQFVVRPYRAGDSATHTELSRSNSSAKPPSSSLITIQLKPGQPAQHADFK